MKTLRTVGALIYTIYLRCCQAPSILFVCIYVIFSSFIYFAINIFCLHAFFFSKYPIIYETLHTPPNSRVKCNIIRKLIFCKRKMIDNCRNMPSHIFYRFLRNSFRSLYKNIDIKIVIFYAKLNSLNAESVCIRARSRSWLYFHITPLKYKQLLRVKE